MTYIDLINNFWKRYEEAPFSSTDTLLYFYLLNEYNKGGRQNSFELSNRRIVLATELSEKTVIACRCRLVQRGLLEFDAGKRKAKSPVYYMDLNCNEVSKKVSKNSSKKVSNEVSKKVSLYNTREEESKESISPTPPKGHGGGSLNSKARAAFEEYWRSLFSEPYYWTAKDAGAMRDILKKLKFQREQKNLSNSDDELIETLKVFLGTITDGWLFQNLSTTNINSKFNEVIANAKEKYNNGNSTTKNKYEQKQADIERRKSETVANIDTIRAAADRRRKELESACSAQSLPRPDGADGALQS